MTEVPATARRLAEGSGGPDLAWRIAQLDAQARTAWATIARRHRWTVWGRLSWAVPVSEFTAHTQVARWASQLRSRAPGAVVLVGQHSDADRRHAHVLIYLPRRGAPKNPAGGWLPGCTRTWLRWSHGLVWVDRYRPLRIRGGGDPRRHGAPAYLTKEVGTVELFGTPLSYVPRKTR